MCFFKEPRNSCVHRRNCFPTYSEQFCVRVAWTCGSTVCFLLPLSSLKIISPVYTWVSGFNQLLAGLRGGFCLPLRHMEVTFRWEIACRVQKFNYWKPRYRNQRRIAVAFGEEIGSRVQQFDLWSVWEVVSPSVASHGSDVPWGNCI